MFPIAQKHIDNVLDIKDDDEEDATNESDSKMVKSKTMPSIASSQESVKVNQDESVWGSFNGSFFENKPVQHGPITNAPPKKTDTSSGELHRPIELNF